MQYKVTREKSNTLFVKISSVDRGNWKTDHLGVRLSWKPSCPMQTRVLKYLVCCMQSMGSQGWT